MDKTAKVIFRTEPEFKVQLRRLAKRNHCTLSRLCREMLRENLKDRQCREMIRKADGRKPQESAQEFLASLDARVERKREEIV